MLELQGKFGTAKVFTDVVDNESISQVINLLNQPYIEGSKVRMMPDIHAGAGCTIGTTMTIKDKICPNLVSIALIILTMIMPIVWSIKLHNPAFLLLWCIPAGIFVGVWAYQEFFDF